jgi:hypothetical protein
MVCAKQEFFSSRLRIKKRKKKTEISLAADKTSPADQENFYITKKEN